MPHKTLSLPYGQYLTWLENNQDLLDRSSVKHGRGIFDNMTIRVWNCRAVMARAIRAQEKRERSITDWKACKPLRETEGYY